MFKPPSTSLRAGRDAPAIQALVGLSCPETCQLAGGGLLALYLWWTNETDTLSIYSLKLRIRTLKAPFSTKEPQEQASQDLAAEAVATRFGAICLAVVGSCDDRVGDIPQLF
jgi:hypothetical protein